MDNRKVIHANAKEDKNSANGIISIIVNIGATKSFKPINIINQPQNLKAKVYARLWSLYIINILLRENFPSYCK